MYYTMISQQCYSMFIESALCSHRLRHHTGSKQMKTKALSPKSGSQDHPGVFVADVVGNFIY